MFVEMAYPVSPDMPVYPGLPRDAFVALSRIARGEGVNTSSVTHPLHNGTHVDAPFHFDDHGLTIDRIPVDAFVFAAPLVVSRPLATGETFRREDLEAVGPSLLRADLLIFCSGYHALRRDASRYADDFPSLSEEAARFIRTELLNVKAVAIDALSIESCTTGPRTGNAVHHALLDGTLHPTRPLLVFEDVNVQPILERVVRRILAFPIRFVGLEASPVAMVAEVD
jgi:arylformamidase